MNLERANFFSFVILFFVAASGFHFDHKIAEKIAFKLFSKKIMKALSRLWKCILTVKMVMREQTT